MQRLTDLFRGRLSDERGASAVVFALLLVPVLGFAAIAVDIGSLYAERARLQVAADAAAIAVAQDCSRGNCGDMLATARAMVAANDGDASAAQPVLNSVPLSVTVTGRTPGAALVRADHRPRLHRGVRERDRRLGCPHRGTAVMPLTFSWCEFSQQTGGGLPSGTVAAHDLLHEDVEHGRLHRAVEQRRPGWVRLPEHRPGQVRGHQRASAASGCPTPATACRRPARRRTSRSGSARPSCCPCSTSPGASGSNAWYRVYGYAAFKLTGYSLGGQYNTSPKPCNGNERCVRGYFTRFVELARRLDLQPDRPAARGLHPPTHPIRGAEP